MVFGWLYCSTYTMFFFSFLFAVSFCGAIFNSSNMVEDFGIIWAFVDDLIVYVKNFKCFYLLYMRFSQSFVLIFIKWKYDTFGSSTPSMNVIWTNISLFSCYDEFTTIYTISSEAISLRMILLSCSIISSNMSWLT